MADNTMLPPPSGPAVPAAGTTSRAGALLAVLVILVGSALLGLAGGLVWAAVAPRVVYQVATLHPPTAYAVNPETNAFIATDGYYCFIAVVGGALIGLLSYLFAVRRYGPAPMAAVVIGSTIAAFIARWIGHRQTGGPGFDHVLATSKQGAVLHAPIALGSYGALAFWPLAAAIVAGGLELLSVLRARHQVAYRGVPTWQDPVGPSARQPHGGASAEQPRSNWPGESGPPARWPEN